MLLTLAETARRLGVSEKIAREIVRTLPSVRIRKRLRYPAEAVAEFAKSGSMTVPQGR